MKSPSQCNRVLSNTGVYALEKVIAFSSIQCGNICRYLCKMRDYISCNIATTPSPEIEQGKWLARRFKALFANKAFLQQWRDLETSLPADHLWLRVCRVV